VNEMVKLAPAILSFLGGPAGGLVGAALQWLAGKTGAKDATVTSIQNALQGMDADRVIEIRRLDIEFQEFCMENDIKLNLAQAEIDKVEAANPNWFVAGWRPFIGWVCGCALCYVSIFEPLARFVADVAFGYRDEFPRIDTNLTMQVLLGMLGLAATRTVEKMKGVESNR